MTTLSVSAISNTASTLLGAVSGNKSGFKNYSMDEMNSGQQLLFIFILMILIYFTMFLGAMIFNTSVVKIFPSVNQVSTMDFFGLYIVLHLLFC